MSFKIAFKRGWNVVRFYLSFLLLAFYLTIAFLFLYTDTWIDFFPKGRGIIGWSVLFFGVLRFYVAYRRYKNKVRMIKELRKPVDQTEAQTSAPIIAEEVESV